MEAIQSMENNRGCLNAFAALIATVVLLSLSSLATTTATVSPESDGAFKKITADPKVRQGLEFIKNDDAKALADTKAIVVISAPPFKEKVRGEYYMKRLQELGLQGLKTDSEGNVYGIRPGTGKGPRLLVEAHLDTVFPEGTNIQLVEKDGKIYAPGVADDSRGLAVLLSVIRAFQTTGIRTVGDIVFCATVGEEGLGDLRGMKAFFKDHTDIAGVVDIDTPADVTYITYLGTGSHRYRVTFNGPGGHSFSAFGTPSAIHAMGRAITKIADVQTPLEPKTTFTVGEVSGGTSVNAIAAKAQMLLDMRSNSQQELLKMEKKILSLIQEGADEENARWGGDKKITVDPKLIGDRPAGSQSPDSMIVQAAWMATKAIGQEPKLVEASSTNANWPISMGVPAVMLGIGGMDGATHSPGEWFDPTNEHLAPQKIFLTILGLVGVDGLSQPLLPAK